MKRLVIVTRLADRHNPDPATDYANTINVEVEDGSLLKMLAQLPDDTGTRWHIVIDEPYV